jgi:hypothetical protein
VQVWLLKNFGQVSLIAFVGFHVRPIERRPTVSECIHLDNLPVTHSVNVRQTGFLPLAAALRTEPGVYKHNDMIASNYEPFWFAPALSPPISGLPEIPFHSDSWSSLKAHFAHTSSII